jgi:hypothetical protein
MAVDEHPQDGGESTESGAQTLRPVVFVAYAYDSPEHEKAVLRLCTLLERNRIAVRVDKWSLQERWNWGEWTEHQILSADYVLAIASPAFRRAGDGHTAPGEHRGARAETSLLRELLQQNRDTWVWTILPVILPGRSWEDVPLFLHAWSETRFVVHAFTDAGAEDLIRHLRGVPAHVPPEQGGVPHVPPRQAVVEPGPMLNTAGDGRPTPGRAPVPPLTEPMTGLIRAAIGGLVAGRPALGLANPVARLRLGLVHGHPTVQLEAAAGSIGVNRVVARCLPDEPNRDALDTLLDLVAADGTATLLAVPADRSAALAGGLRSLVRQARTTATANEFVAEVLRSDRRTTARRVLAVLQAGESTTERRRTLHAQLRRLWIPRPAELDALLRLWPDDPAAAARSSRMYDEAVCDWPRPLDVAADTTGPPPTGRVFAVPGQGNPAEDVTRRNQLETVARLLADRRSAVRLALVGASGVGKSALATRVCRELESNYQVVGWLPAADAGSWQSSVAVLAKRLGAPEAGAAELWDLLADRGPTLVVVDDAPDPAAFAESLPWRPGLHLLITSQSVRWRSAAAVVELGPLDESEATEFLLARTGAEDDRLASAVASRLGGYPIALEQAAAAVVDGLSLRGWLDRYGAEATTGVTALRQAWEVRIVGLRTRHPDALALLRILACAGVTPTPGELLARLGSDFDDPALAVCADIARRDAAVAELRSQSLVRTGADEETVFVHPLLAEVVRADPQLDVAGMAMLVGAVAGRQFEEGDVDDADCWARTAALVSAAVGACRLVLQEVERSPRRFDRGVTIELANHALWLAAAYLHERGAAREAYLVRLLGLALHGDTAAAARVRDWTGEAPDALNDLVAADVLPADQLGSVGPGERRLSAARWINETASLLADVDVPLAEAYARRALALVPRRVASAAPAAPVPWPARTRIEILDNLGFVMMLREDYPAATRVFDQALRLHLSFPGAETAYKYGELVNDRALALLDGGLPEPARREFLRAASIARTTSHPDPNVAHRIGNNLALAEHEAGLLRPAHQRLLAGLEWLWDRADAQSTEVAIQQCNTGLVAYDLGLTDEGFALVHGSWQALADRLGPGDRETLVRRIALARLQAARGELSAAHEAVLADLDHSLATVGDGSPWAPVRRVQSAWLTGLHLLTWANTRQLATGLLDAFGRRGAHAAAALDLLTASALVAGGTGPGVDDRRTAKAAQAVAVHRVAHGTHHPNTLLAVARLALVRVNLTARRRHLAKGTARQLLSTPDSLTRPGWDGFAADLARHGQPPVDLDQPGRESERLAGLLAGDIVDLDPGEQLCWQANAGRLAALAASADANGLLREAATGSAALYGPYHPWTLLRRATAAVAANDPEALRSVTTAPRWI